MKYSELIHFEPIDEVIQLRLADEESVARELVETYVISDRLADQLNGLVLPHLQFEEPQDNKGLLVVGNYGTGKSHLMAVLSAVAEHAGLAERISHPAVVDKAKAIAGRFKVIRIEIGAVTMPLRDIICGQLEEHLSEMGVSFTFPSTDAVTNNKDAFIEMMGAFQQKYPDQGLLLVVDELLDYLRGRRDQELVLDLGFLREVGEVCKITRFRFMAGVQESLFDNPRFQFVAGELRRVKDRFEQARIVREDVAFVVAERLLKKDERQEGLIRAHLQKFAPLYGSMNERMDEFVRLFPVHPAYLDTFEQVYVAEKREILKTLSRAIRDLIDREVPEDEPGLIAYDSYWKNLTDNPSFRAIPEIKEVIDRSSVLESRIQNAYPNPRYKPVALRIIHGLSVHRLTTGDIYAPIGPTAAELRDNLCLMLPIPEQDAGFLQTMVEKVLKDIVTTVSGQFISFNAENGQYYLDLKKDIDFDALIEQRARSLTESELDRYYFDALRRVVLEDPDAPEYRSGYRIWEHEVVWRERQAGRTGYLFFGAPNERSNTQPPRDFYLYFLQLYDPPRFKDEHKPDEVFFRLKRPDETLEEALRLYAGAREQAVTASGANKRIYEEKAQEHLRALTKWLREQMPTAFDVTHEGRTRSLAETVQGRVKPGEADSIRDLVNIAAATSLATHFEELAPEYPTFLRLITRENREQAAQEALRWIGGAVKSQQGAGVLDALELLDGGELRPRESRYAREVLDRLSNKGEGQVLNRSELIETEATIEYWNPGRFRLEPEFLIVVLAALVHSGDLVLSVPGGKYDAAATDQFAKVGIRELLDFKHVERPKDLPLGALQELFELLGLNKGLLVNPDTREQAAVQLVTEANRRVKEVVEADQQVRSGLSIWGKPILAESEQAAWTRRLGELKEFLESLQPYNTAGKLKNFRYDVPTIQKQHEGLRLVGEVRELTGLIEQLRPLTGYLETAEMILPGGHPWTEKVRDARNVLVGKLASPKHRSDSSFQRGVMQQLTELKAEYQDAYSALHAKARLDAVGDKRKAALNTDPRLKQIRALASVEGMPKQELTDFENRLLGLQSCFYLSKEILDASPVCSCGYRPVEEPNDAPVGAVLDQLDMRLDEMIQDWTRTLLSDLEDPMVVESLELLGEGEGANAVREFRERKILPDPVGPEFVRALQDVLAGLEGISIQEDNLRAALVRGGARCTVQELRERFENYLAELTRGKDINKVRVVLE